jgi:SAM-dependent methyltransferase
MFVRQAKDESRTGEQLREHYEVEKELAARLRNASRQERRYLYSSLYDEMYRRVPHHPMLSRKSSPEQTARSVADQMKLLKRFLHEDETFLEVGSGDCALSFAVAKFVKKVYAVEVSEEIAKNYRLPQNFQLVISDGCTIPVPPNSVNLAYSHQLMEHLHPDDAVEQLQNIYKALCPGGIYICITPNGLNGPHDISQYFDDMATGFHLKEYTITELTNLFKQAGFSKVVGYFGVKGNYIGFSVLPSIVCEKLLSKLPPKLRRTIASNLPFKFLLRIRLAGIK